MPKRRTKRNSVVVAVNPKSGSGHRLGLVQSLVAKLIELGYRPQVHEDLDNIISATREALEADDLQAVVSAGGDGTAGLLVNRLPAGFPLLVMPLGTENLLAKYLGIAARVEQIAELVDRGRRLKMDVGRANGTYFLIMASCGFDADVVRRLHGSRRGNIGHLSYLRPLWQTITRYRYPSLKISIDGRPLPIQPRWAFVFNAPRYAMNLQIAPEASGFDQRLDVCTFQKGTLWNGLRYVWSVLWRRQRRGRDATHHQGASVRIESDQEVPFQLDGDPGGVLPLQIEVVPRYLTVIAPQDFVAPDMAVISE